MHATNGLGVVVRNANVLELLELTDRHMLESLNGPLAPMLSDAAANAMTTGVYDSELGGSLIRVYKLSADNALHEVEALWLHSGNVNECTWIGI